MFPRLAFLLLALAGAVHAADQVPIVPAGADKRFELALDPKTRIKGLAPAQAAQFRGRIDTLTGYLRTLDVLTQPPAPLCMRLSSWLELQADPLKGAQATVDAHYPVAFERGRCTRVTGDGVGIYVNHDAPIFDRRYRVAGLEDREVYRLPLADHDGRVIHLKGNAFVVTRQGQLPWRPAKRKEVLGLQADRLEANLRRMEQGDRDMNALLLKQTGKPFTPRPEELRARARERALLARIRDALAAGDSEEPVCLDEQYQYAGIGCAPENMVMEPNPAYWAGSAPDRIALIVVSTGGPSKWESKEKEALRMGVFRALDLDRLVEMVAP